MTRNTVEALQAARDLISDPDRWCQGVSARTRSGAGVPPDSPDAVQWCAVGALYRHDQKRVTDLAASSLQVAVASSSLPKRGDGLLTLSAVDVNDLHGHAAVMEVYDRAIELAKKETSAAPTDIDTELVYLIVNVSGTIDYYSFHEKIANDFNRDYLNGDAIVFGSFETEAALSSKQELL